MQIILYQVTIEKDNMENDFEYIPNSFDRAIKRNSETPSFKDVLKSNFHTSFSQQQNLDYDTRLGTGTKWVPKEEVDIFRNQKNYNPIGFNPFNPDNHAKWANDETWKSALGKGFQVAKYNFGEQFKGWWKTYGRIATALANWDFGKMTDDEAIAIQDYYKQSQVLSKYHAFAEEGREDDIFTWASMSQMIGNAGFTLGTLTALSFEVLGGVALTVATKGLAGPVVASSLAKTAGKSTFKGLLKKGAQKVPLVMQGMSAASEPVSVAYKAEQARRLAQAAKGSNAMKNMFARELKDALRPYTFNVQAIVKSKNFTQFADNVIRGIPLVGTAYQTGQVAVHTARAGTGGSRMLGVGLGGLRRITQEYVTASTEASAYTVMGYGETLDFMLQNYREKHGDYPEIHDYEKMRELAMKSHSANYWSNMPIILMANKIQFGGIFNRFAGGSRAVRDLIGKSGRSTFVRGIKTVGEKSYKGFSVYTPKGIWGAAGNFRKVLEDFGKVKALKKAGRRVGKSLFRFEIVQGLEEVALLGTEALWRNYYGNQFHDDSYGMSQALDESADAMWSKQGWKTFVHAGFTGTLVRGPVSAMHWATRQAQIKSVEHQYKDNPNLAPHKIAKEQAQQNADTMNKIDDMLLNPESENRKNILKNLTESIKNSEGQENAQENGDSKNFKEFRENLIIQGAVSAQRLNLLEVYVDSIQDLGLNLDGQPLTVAEFQEAFGIDITEEGFNSVPEYTKSVANKIKTYAQTLETVRDKFHGYVDPSLYTKEEERYINLVRRMQEEAIEFVAYHKIKGDEAFKGAEEVRQKILNNEVLSKTSHLIFEMLTDPEPNGGLLGEIGQIQNEIRTDKDIVKDIESKEYKNEVEKRIKENELLLSKLKKWQSFFAHKEDGAYANRFHGELIKESKNEEGETIYEYDNKSNSVVNLFREIVNLKNKQIGSKVSLTENQAKEVFNDVLDYMELSRDSKEFLTSYDKLNNPDIYSGLVKRMRDGYVGYWASQSLNYIESNFQSLSLSLYQVKEEDLQKLKDKLNEIQTAIIEKNNDSLQELLSDETVQKFLAWESYLLDLLKKSEFYQEVQADILRNLTLNDVNSTNENMQKLIALSKFIVLKYTDKKNNSEYIKNVEDTNNVKPEELIDIAVAKAFKLDLTDNQNKALESEKKIDGKTHKEIVDDYTKVLEHFKDTTEDFKEDMQYNFESFSDDINSALETNRLNTIKEEVNDSFKQDEISKEHHSQLIDIINKKLEAIQDKETADIELKKEQVVEKQQEEQEVSDIESQSPEVEIKKTDDKYSTTSETGLTTEGNSEQEVQQKIENNKNNKNLINQFDNIVTYYGISEKISDSDKIQFLSAVKEALKNHNKELKDSGESTIRLKTFLTRNKVGKKMFDEFLSEHKIEKQQKEIEITKESDVEVKHEEKINSRKSTDIKNTFNKKSQRKISEQSFLELTNNLFNNIC